MSLDGIAARTQPGVTAHYGLAPNRRDADDPSRVRASTTTMAGRDGGNVLVGGLAVGGVAAIAVGIGSQFTGHRGIGLGIGAVGAVMIGASLLASKLTSGPSGPPIPGDEGESGGSVSTFPDSLEMLRPRADSTNPAPASYDPKSGSRDAREGVVQLVHSGGTGSGWVVEPQTLVTNYHVAQGYRELTVVDHKGDEHTGTVRKLDRQHDLAIVDVPSLKDAPLSMDDTVDLGEIAETTGYPGGEFNNDRAKAVGLVDVDDDGRRRQALFLSGHSDEGVSGGAVINGSGEVIGTAFAVGEFPNGNPNIDDGGFVLAIPNDQVQSFLDAPTPTVPTDR